MSYTVYQYITILFSDTKIISLPIIYLQHMGIKTTHNPQSPDSLCRRVGTPNVRFSVSLGLPIYFITSDDKNKFVVFLTEFEARPNILFFKDVTRSLTRQDLTEFLIVRELLNFVLSEFQRFVFACCFAIRILQETKGKRAYS